MVSLDDAVLARWEKGGSRYEILVDPDLVQKWRNNPDSVQEYSVRSKTGRAIVLWEPASHKT